MREGAALFWRTSRFRAAAARDLSMRDVFKRPLAPPHAQFEAMLAASPHLAEALQKVTTVAQLVLLVPVGGAHDGGSSSSSNGTSAAAGAAAAADAAADADAGGAAAPPLLVVNTHLFFHPYAPHIRSMHVAAMLEEAAAAIEVRRADCCFQEHGSACAYRCETVPVCHDLFSPCLSRESQLLFTELRTLD